VSAVNSQFFSILFIIFYPQRAQLKIKPQVLLFLAWHSHSLAAKLSKTEQGHRP
jgi:hypothetical protein